ncbi:DUF6985 domain-containing protein [Streptomyces sp. NPDC048496]|uniref:DUF6985 domain-containing protein n=1 Tax=Streptomyces sp. NPDC048496 TaxID=3365558 RepID=UPI00371CCF5D
MEIPGLGPVTVDADFGGYRSLPLPVPVLGDAICQVMVIAYDDDEAKSDFHSAIGAFLALDESALKSASLPVFQYYQDVQNELGDEDLVSIANPEDVWRHVRPGAEVTVERDAHGDRLVYVSIECECAWEPEHGLQIVLRGGRSVSKVGPFDGHLTHASAFDSEDLADVIYHRFG